MVNFPSTLTPGADNSEAGSYVMALLAKSSVAVDVSGVRFYSPAAQTGTGAAVYAAGAANGTPLVEQMQNLVIGWNEITFPTPVTLVPNGEYFFAVLLPGPTVHYTALTAGVTDAMVEGDFTAVHPGGFHTPGTTLELSAAPHWGGASDGGQFTTSGTPTWYGIELVTDVAAPELDPLTFTVERTSDTEATLTWGALPSDAPDGVTVMRAVGQFTVDGNANSFGDPDYDPTTIPGAIILAEGELGTSVTDTSLSAAEVYTYAIVRTASP